jgi:hypothetical protein
MKDASISEPDNTLVLFVLYVYVACALARRHPKQVVEVGYRLSI